MKFLVLAYGSKEGWEKLTEREREEALAQDDVLRARGDLVTALKPSVIVRAPDQVRTVTQGPFAKSDVPLAGCGIIEAPDLDKAIELVTKTPCARAGGAVEIWPFWDLTRED